MKEKLNFALANPIDLKMFDGEDVLGQLSKGSTLGFSATSGGTYTTINGIAELPAIDAKGAGVDVTDLSMDIKTEIEGLIDAKEIEIDIFYKGSNFDAVLALNGTEKFWRYAISGGLQATFKGTVSVGLDGAKTGDAVKFKLFIKLTAKPVIGRASA
jgi:hypothetical protein